MVKNKTLDVLIALRIFEDHVKGFVFCALNAEFYQKGHIDAACTKIEQGNRKRLNKNTVNAKGNAAQKIYRS
jgi:hypothetical protein